MTTILADAKLGVMVSDSSVDDGDRVWKGRKVFRIRGALVGIGGSDAARQRVFAWLRAGMVGRIDAGDCTALILSEKGLYVFDHNYKEPQRVESGREAAGSGAKAAMCTYEALGWTDPKRAVHIVCKHASASRAPVRIYRLKATA